MILGIDFDNTLACYDGLFHAEAVKRNLLSAESPQDKNSVRDALRENGLEEEFTLLQGYIYGPGMVQASLYQGAMKCLESLKEHRVKLVIVSHKTPFPYLGPRYDLHTYARNWLEEKKFHENNLIERQNVFFEASKEDKLERIAQQKCTHFIDDLPDILEHPLFPATVEALLFSPEQNTKSQLTSFISWQNLTKYLLSII